MNPFADTLPLEGWPLAFVIVGCTIAALVALYIVVREANR